MKRYAVSVVLGASLILLSACGHTSGGPTNNAPSATGSVRAVFAGTSAALIPWVDDPDMWETFSFQVLSQPINGTASVVSNQLLYTPSSAFKSGTDNFTYQATDHGGATVTGVAAVRVFSSTALSVCTTTGTVNADGTINTRTKSNQCTFYSVGTTRVTNNGTGVTMDYFINWPSNASAPKAVVVLIGGANLNMNFSGDTTLGVPDSSGGGNFLVRTAQLFAEAGYLTVAINRPSDLPTNATNADADQYRISVNHAVDILTVLKHINTQNLPVFLAGTSHGAISAVAANLIATGISLSSPVTNNSDNPSNLYVGDPNIANLKTSFVQRPVHVLWNTNDLCSVAPPAGSQTLCNSLSGAMCNSVSGGLEVTTPGNGVTSSDIGPCQSYDFHGYFGIETAAVSSITNWLNGEVAALAGNHPPETAFATVATAAGVSIQTNLATLTRDQDGDALSYALSHTTTSLGGSVTINGSTVTYSPPPGVSNKTDYYVYIANDGRGGVGAGVITVQIGN